MDKEENYLIKLFKDYIPNEMDKVTFDWGDTNKTIIDWEE